jgi:hypothetical protein
LQRHRSIRTEETVSLSHKMRWFFLTKISRLSLPKDISTTVVRANAFSGQTVEFIIFNGVGTWNISCDFVGFFCRDSPQSVGLIWTSNQLVAEISIYQHTTFTTEKHMPQMGFEPTISAGERPQTYALDRQSLWFKLLKSLCWKRSTTLVVMKTCR